MKKGISIFFQVLIFFLAIVLIAVLSYIVGRPYLVGNSITGNDAYSFYSVVLWVSKYFPNVPFWYPLAGGGVSVTSGYPVFAAYIVVFITKISHLDLTQAFRLLGFLSVPCLAFGVFSLVYLRLTFIKSGITRAILGLIAAVFVVVSPSSWLWLTRWGFYAESASYLFVPWAILFFDLFLENAIDGKRDWGYRIGIFGSVVFIFLAFLTHFLSLASLVVFFGVVAIVRFNKKIIIPGIVLGVIVFGAVFFKLTAYQYYMGQVAVGGFSGYGRMAYSEMANNTLPLPMWLSLSSPTTIMDSHALIFDMRFPLYVWILFFLGLIFSFKKSKKVFSFAVYGLLGLLLSGILPFKYFVSGIPLISGVATLMEDRGYLIVARVIIPVVAVYGSYAIWEALFKKIWIATILAIAGTAVLIFLFYNSPYKSSFLVGTGAFGGVSDLRDIWNKFPNTGNLLYSNDIKIINNTPEYALADFRYMNGICLQTTITLVDPGSICDVYNKDKSLIYPPVRIIDEAKTICDEQTKNGELGEKYQFCKAFYSSLSDQLNLKNWPVFSISSSNSDEAKVVGGLFAPIPSTGTFRYDLSGFTGGNIMATPLVTQNSQIQLYINTLSLIYNSWNYQSQVMYSNLAATQKPGVLTELGKWFGLNYVYLKGSTLEPSKYWQTDQNWQKIFTNETLGGWEKFQTPVSLVSWDTRPKVLVITDTSRGLYDQTFRFATWGALPYDNFNLIIGKKSVDSYSLDELKKYDLILMRGYSYNSQSGAYNLLNDYVKGGGKLIFDTGWQYEIPDYQLSQAPDFMPFDSLVWKNLSTDSDYSLNSDFNNVDVSKFGDLKYGDSSWGISAAQGLRSGAKVDLSYDNQPLIVSGSFGKGKVTWIGFNIIAHAIAKDSTEEAKLFNLIANQMVSSGSSQSLDVSYLRPNPDKVEFKLNSDSNKASGIYFRESYFPYWHAYLISEGKSSVLTVESAGPGFMYIDLPPVKTGDSVTLEIEIPIWQKIADLISLLSFVLVLNYLFHPEIFSKIKLPKIHVKMPKINFSDDDEDKNY